MSVQRPKSAQSSPVGESSSRTHTVAAAIAASGQDRLVQEEADHTATTYARERELSASFRAQREFVLSCIGQGNRRILEIGCAAGNMLPHLADLGTQVFGFDLSLERVRAARESLGHHGLAQANAAHLPYANDVFDVVLAMGVAEFITDRSMWLHEIRRVLQPRGKLVLTFLHDRCVARMVGNVLLRAVRVLQGRAGAWNVPPPGTPERWPPRVKDFDELLESCRFKKMFSTYCGLRLTPWPFDRFGMLRTIGRRLEWIRWLARRPAFGSVHVLAARLAAEENTQTSGEDL